MDHHFRGIYVQDKSDKKKIRIEAFVPWNLKLGCVTKERYIDRENKWFNELVDGYDKEYDKDEIKSLVKFIRTKYDVDYSEDESSGYPFYMEIKLYDFAKDNLQDMTDLKEELNYMKTLLEKEKKKNENKNMIIEQLLKEVKTSKEMINDLNEEIGDQERIIKVRNKYIDSLKLTITKRDETINKFQSQCKKTLVSIVEYN